MIDWFQSETGWYLAIPAIKPASLLTPTWATRTPLSSASLTCREAWRLRRVWALPSPSWLSSDLTPSQVVRSSGGWRPTVRRPVSWSPVTAPSVSRAVMRLLCLWQWGDPSVTWVGQRQIQRLQNKKKNYCSGLGCDAKNLTLVGPERCVCGGDHQAIVEPGETSWLCTEGQYCYQDPDVNPALRHSHACVDACQEMPIHNSEACFCHHQVCNEPTKLNYCFHNSTSCQTFERCPYTTNILYNHSKGYKPDSKDKFNLEFCVCGFDQQTKLCNQSQYCLAEKIGIETGWVENFYCQDFILYVSLCAI